MLTIIILPWVWIWICSQQIHGILGSCSNDSLTNWRESQIKYPKLIQLFQDRTKGELEPGGSSTLKLVNWQDQVLRLACPDTPVNGEVEKWKLRYFSDPENDKTEKLEEKFKKKEPEGWQLIVESPSAYEYFAVYSCLTNDDCWHHFYVVTQAGPRTKFPVHITTGSNGWFDCVGRSKNPEENEEYPINYPLQNISWIFPSGSQPDNVNITLTNRTLKGVNSYWNSTIELTEASEINAGVYECVFEDKYGVSSRPSFEGKHLPTGDRYRAIAHVHIRPLNYTLIPLGIIGIQLLIIPLLVRFCHTAKGEADLEEDDNDDSPPNFSGSRKKLNSSGDENNDFELEKAN